MGERSSYTATAQGFGGPVTVTAVVEDGRIAAVSAEGTRETPARGGAACAQLASRLAETGGARVDTVSGATVTSEAVFAAMDDILAQAGLAAGDGDAARMKPGVYVGEGWGFDWIEPVRVKITVDERSLLSVDLIELELNREEPVIQQAAAARLIPRMLENQSVAVDAVTGATAVSSGIRLATRDALRKALAAGGSGERAIRRFEKPVEKRRKAVELRYDVVVAGMGGAGTAAALSAAEQMRKAGRPVRVLAVEAAGKYGGTAANAGEAFAVNPKRYCAAYNGGRPYTEADSLWDHWINTFTKGDCKQELVRLFFETSGDTIDWLEFDHHVHMRSAMRGFGDCAWPVKYQYVYISNREEGRDYGDTVLGDRSSTVGQYYDRLVRDYTALGGEYLLETACCELLYDRDADRVTGVKALGDDGTEYLIRADAVILAGGGFHGSPEMLEKYLKNDYYPLKSGDWRLWGMYQNKGQMLESAIRQGAATCNIGMVPCTHFKCTDDTLSCYPVYYRDGLEERTQKQNVWSLNDVPLLLGIEGASMQIGPDGRRHYDEGAPFDCWKGGPVWYTVFGTDRLDELAEKGFAGRPGSYAWSGKVYACGGYPCCHPVPQVYEVMEKAVEKGYVFKADTLEALAGKLGVPAEALLDEAARYRGFCAAGADADFSKRPALLKDYLRRGPYYAVKCRPTPYSTVAALDVNADINVLKTDGSVMNGLYACGNDSGGVLYSERDAYAQYGGVALGWALTSGRLAGIHAVEYLQTR